MTHRERFEKFHQENPGVYALFKRFAFELVRAGRTRISAGMIFERIRWETAIKTTGDRYKINDIFEPYYARKFMEDNPQYEGIFATRRLRVA